MKFLRSKVLCSSITGIFRVLKIYSLPVQWNFRVLKKYIFQCREFFRVLRKDNLQCSEISGTEKKTNYSSGIFPRLWKWPGFHCTHSPPKFPAHLWQLHKLKWTIIWTIWRYSQQSKWTIFWTIWKIITRIEMDHYLDHSEMDHFYKNGPLFGPFEPTSKWTITTISRGHNWTTVLF